MITNKGEFYHKEDACFNGLEELFLMEKSVNYHKWLIDITIPYISGEVLEIGAGIGSFTNAWLSHSKKVYAVEIAPNCCEILKERYKENRQNVSILCEDFMVSAISNNSIDAIISFNVFEHIEDDIKCFRKINKLLNRDGYFVMFVPACRVLYATVDKKVGHVRRYTKKEIKEKFELSNLDIVEMRYINALGFFAYLLKYKILKSQMTKTDIVVFDRFIIPFSKVMEHIFNFPFGQSLFVVARKKRAAS